MTVGVCSTDCEVLDGGGRVDSRPEKTQQGSRGVQQAIKISPVVSPNNVCPPEKG